MTLLPTKLAEQAIALYLADGDDAVLAIQALYAPIAQACAAMCGDILDNDDTITVVR